jgi:myosin-15
MCGLLNITSAEEREEFSIYCIVEGDTFTMPLMKEEYILDVTTELYKNQQVFYLIFCRSVWYFPLRLDSESYIEVVFNQVAPDYLEGLLLTMPGGNLRQSDIHDISRIAALLHRAADLKVQPNLKETKYLLPKPALAARDMKPAQWVSLVSNYWDDIRALSPASAKGNVLEILQAWPLFGSSFFSVRRIVDPSPPEEYIMALNKSGVHFLDVVTHEPLNYSPYNEIISTRKVKNEEGVLYLDIKFGNLMQQRISRIQTEHAHEISRLIRMYISIQKGGSSCRDIE